MSKTPKYQKDASRSYRKRLKLAGLKSYTRIIPPEWFKFLDEQIAKLKAKKD